MVRIPIVLLLTVTTVQAGEMTLACEGTQTPVQYGKAQPIVDVADESVTWEGYRAALDPGHQQNHTLRFKWKDDENCQEASAAPATESAAHLLHCSALMRHNWAVIAIAITSYAARSFFISACWQGAQ